MRPRKINEEGRQRIARWAFSRKTREQIANEEGVSVDTVDRIVKEVQEDMRRKAAFPVEQT
jgi:hypothetical protein